MKSVGKNAQDFLWALLTLLVMLIVLFSALKFIAAHGGPVAGLATKAEGLASPVDVD